MPIGLEPHSWRFRPDIEGLRAVAILGVVLFHAGVRPISGGFLGVDVFFVLSGFLITGILAAEVEKTGTVSLSAFWARRARRLLPAAAVVSLATLLLGSAFDSPFTEQVHAKSALAFATYWSNMLFVRRGADYFDRSLSTDPYLHTWSLAVEEQYYLAFAPLCLLLVAITGKRNRGIFRRRLLGWTLGVSIVSFAGCFLLTAKNPLLSFYGLPSRAWEFGIGGLLALRSAQSTRESSRWDEILSAAALLAIVAAWFLAGDRTRHPGWITLLPVLGTAALIHVGARERTNLGKLLESSNFRALGRLSYSWYLWHWPITVYWSRLSPGDGVPLVIGMPLLSLALAQATYLAVEAPARRASWLQRPNAGLLAALGLALTTSLAAAAAIRQGKQRLLGPEYAFVREARDSKTRLALDNCELRQLATMREACSYGTTTSDTLVVLFGDSHAAQWFPAIERVVAKRGWHFVPLTMRGCPSLFVRVWHSPSPEGECDIWRDAALARIRTLNPTVIVVSNYRWHELLDDGSETPHLAASSPERWERGLRATLDRLPATSSILLVGDVPVPHMDVPTCLVEHAREVTRCSFRRAAGAAADITKVERDAAGRDARVTYADLTDQFCDASICQTAQDRIAIFRDGDHLSTAFAASLAPQLLSILDTVLASRRNARAR